MQNTEKTGAVLRKLFFSTLYISTFTFGGGFVIINFMKKKFVDELHWIDENEMPVSYTHIDVYKRQGLGRLSRMP